MRDLLISCPRKKSRGFLRGRSTNGGEEIHRRMQSRQRNAARRRYGAEGTPAARCNNHSLCYSPTGWDGPVPVRLAARRGGTAPSPSGSRKNYVISARTSKSRGKTRSAESRQLGFCRAREALCPDERGSGAEMTYFFQRAASGCASPRYAPQRSVLTSPKNPGRTS